MSKRGRVAIALILLGGAAGAWYLRGDGPSDGSVSASGTVEATTVDLGFQVAGRIHAVLVDEGDTVVAGAELARLDTRELVATVEAARAQVQAAQARLEELLAGARPQELASSEAAVRAASQRAETARRELARARTLYEGGAISQQAMDQAETALEVAEAARDQASESLALLREGARRETVRAQQAQVAQARANLTRVEASLANAVITAPMAGLITLEHRRVGETVGAGAPVLTLLDRSDRWVRIYVPEDRMGAVQIGMSASISSDTYPDRRYDGEVVFIGSEAEFTPRNVQTEEERTKLVYPVKVRIRGDEGFELKPGIPADVVLLEPDA